jgi:hypothetical protein
METLRPDISFDFYDENGVPTGRDYHPSFNEIAGSGSNSEISEAYELDDKVIKKLAVEKPEWFKSCEVDARKFLSEFDLDVSCPVYLLKEGRLLRQIDIDDPAVVASYDSFTNRVYVRKKRIDEWRDRYGTDFATSGLVHEMAHGTALPVTNFAVHKFGNGDEDVTVNFRSGWSTNSRQGELGTFYEEAFAKYVAGLYRRRCIDPGASLVSICGNPNLELPPHFNYECSNNGERRMTAGPDGYAIELLAYGVEQKGIMRASDFIRNMFAGRNRDTETEALRVHAWAIEQLEPGLYVYLRGLEYSSENWLEGLRRVHDIVTRGQKKAPNNNGDIYDEKSLQQTGAG